MPRKRKAAAAKAGGKKKKVEDPPATDSKTDIKKKVEALKTAEKGKKKTYVVDSYYFGSGAVYEDFDCMLNQTNISQNNNKYYVIQLIQSGKNYTVWTRWGRVGEPGANQMNSFSDVSQAIKAFEKKFQDKTRNKWDERANFAPVAGKYTLIEVEQSEDVEEDLKKLSELEAGGSKKTAKSEYAPSKLDTPTQKLMDLIFDNNMFQEQMANFELDVKKMPLGKLSKAQLAKGFDALEAIETAINNKAGTKKLQELSSRFYTLIPHSFGRKLPPTISQAETVQNKKDMLLVLSDIVIAQDIKREQDETLSQSQAAVAPNPLDVNYELLKCKLEHVAPKSEEHKVISTYVDHTKGGWRQPKLLNVWKVAREGEDKRFAAHKNLENRRLLWHGTNVAVVAAILKTGLRIMPHSGGRVGRGIYFASEHSKSAGYVGTTNSGTGIMFLNEVVLGEEHHITMDDSSLRSAPPGSHCVIAKGRTEPDPKHETHLVMDGKKVTVPQGKPVNQSKYNNSYFSQSEYLVYSESQNRIRYMLEFNFR
ncbi:protein mono-ADP-ribosyltransferase PARP3-like [Patiria miniata]|uniref:Poly [ADP-ribose] polymerase n=1 Tax=Patiria miniata TaxID=46514 RepID=A0A913ZRN2_PATMI|nr:protein mono-ADP-ribosyltransferase PARP3-like [Patiria miniata]